MRTTDLSPNAFSKATLIIDIDGTLVPDHTEEPSVSIAEFIQALRANNAVYLASNGDATRTVNMARNFGVHALPRLRKPLPFGVRNLPVVGRKIVIGDKMITDGLFAKFIGAEFIRVDHVRAETDKVIARTLYTIDSIVRLSVSFGLLMRPSQWIKNVLVFMPLFFAGKFFSAAAFSAAVVAFITFCIAASIAYVLNDMLDREADRAHPSKQHRPIASGDVTLFQAIGLLTILSIVLIATLSQYPVLTPIVLTYIALSSGYSLWLKHVAVADILTVASFYVLRIIGGGMAVGVALSSWIVLCAFFGALFLITGKRRAELRHTTRRKVLTVYSKKALDYLLAATAGLAIVSYGLYSILGHPESHLIYSTLFVSFAVLRMRNQVYACPEKAEMPERMLLHDPVVFGLFAVWFIYMSTFFYLF